MSQVSTDIRNRLRNAARVGSIATAGAPILDASGNASASNDRAAGSAPPTPGVFTEPPVPPLAAAGAATTANVATAPGVATPSAAAAAAQRLSAYAQESAAIAVKRGALKELAAMKTLTRLLEAVYARPGSAASDEDRMRALSILSSNSMALGQVVAEHAGEDAERSQYIRAVSMEAVVGLVCKAWENNREIDWAGLLDAAASMPEVVDAAHAMAAGTYRPVKTVADASDRLLISMHAAYWQIYTLGDSVDGVTPQLAAEIMQRCADYLNGRERFVADNDLQVSWMQGSIRRMTDLVCAEFRARFGGKGESPSEADVSSVLSVAFSGFEGVENYAQSILERPGPSSVSRPVAG